jgi:hypothetical protein
MGHNTPAQGRMHDLSEGHGTAVSLLKVPLTPATGEVRRGSHRHPVNGCFLTERGGVEGTPSTNRNFEPFSCFLLA